MSNEATARIKINKLLEASGWRFFADGQWPSEHPVGANRLTENH